MLFSLQGTLSVTTPLSGVSAAARPPPQPGSRLDSSDLAPLFQEYVQAGLAQSTHRTYDAAMRHFTQFCLNYSIQAPFPVHEHLLCYFATYLAKKNLAPQTIKTYLAAVRNAQIAMGLPDPRDQSSMPLLKRVQAGISRIRLQAGKSTKLTRLPITFRILQQICKAWASSRNPDRVLLCAVATTAFFGFFRLGELLPTSQSAWKATTDLAWGDVAVDDLQSPRMIQVHLKQSKCDQSGIGADVVLGTTGVNVCPVGAVTQYLHTRGPDAGPFFVDHAGQMATKAWFVQQVRKALLVLNLPAHLYAGHSFRIGAATSAALSGVQDSLIQTLLRWHSAAFLRYIRTPKSQLASVSARLAG